VSVPPSPRHARPERGRVPVALGAHKSNSFLGSPSPRARVRAFGKRGHVPAELCHSRRAWPRSGMGAAGTISFYAASRARGYGITERLVPNRVLKVKALRSSVFTFLDARFVVADWMHSSKSSASSGPSYINLQFALDCVGNSSCDQTRREFLERFCACNR
jgi:hypothetical protein